MYIRKTFTNNPQTGAVYSVYRLVESIRTPKGPRQRVVLNLGSPNLNKVEQKKLARILETRLAGQTSFFEGEKKLVHIADEALQNLNFRQTEARIKADLPVPDLVQVDMNSMGMGHIRTAGPEILGHYAWKLLGLEDFLRKSGFSPFEVALSEMTIVGRLIQPGSERQTRYWMNHQSALPELLAIEEVGKNTVYEISDRIFAHKKIIENHLYEREQRLFPQTKFLFLYDLTNTYFEGQAHGNDLARRGHSKEKRTDRPLVTLALLVNSQGFPIFSQVYRGNQGEPETLRAVLDHLEIEFQGVFPSSRPTIVMDRGIATAGNIALIRSKEFAFVVVERRQTEKEYESDFANLVGFSNFQTLSGPIKLKKVTIPNGVRVLVQSEGRVAKERAMDSLKEKRFLEDVEKVASSVQKGNIVVPEKVGRRIGRILQRYPSMSSFYEINTEIEPKGTKVTKVHLVRKEVAHREETLRGCYVIETSHQDLEAKEIWDLYTTLHRVEKAFNFLKSVLGFRPIHHQLAKRTEAHLFISVIAYHLLITIETLLEKAGDHRTWRTIRTVMSTLVRGTMTFLGNQGIAHQIRVTGILEPEHRKILECLKIASPFGRKHRQFQTRL